MKRIDLPPPLHDLLSGHELGDAFAALNHAASPILRDNKLPFFPDYTDHGAEHVQAVLEDQLRLLAPEVLASSALTAGDAFLISTSTVLHDLAMHLGAAGFFELLRDTDRKDPYGLRFRTKGSSFISDRPWQDEWRAYIVEARDWGEKKQIDVFGRTYSPTSKRWRKWLDVAIAKKSVNIDQRFGVPLIGEFFRRHHARLAYEISVFGFPGAGSEFPTLHKLVPGTVGELAGFVARSHHFSIRDSARFVRERLDRQIGPFESHPVLAMVLLRISDYLQIAADRAPDILLNVRKPVSPLSVREWKKHAVLNPVSFALADQETLFFEARSTKPTHEILVAVKSLLSDLQSELDQSNSALREEYPKWGAAASLRLGYSLIRSDFDTEAFLNALPYIPKETGVKVDSSIVGLLAGPLYGNRPEFAIRELIQNAVDAVVECRHRYPSDPEQVSRYVQDADVEVLFKQRKKGWKLWITDCGIGMKQSTILDSLLKVGVSFRTSAEWKEIFHSDKGHIEIARSGRFGVGIFSAFLLGDRINISTRHIDQEWGYILGLEPNTESVTIRKEKNLMHGTRVKINLTHEAAIKLGLEQREHQLFGKGWDWWTWNRPSVSRKIRYMAEPILELAHEYSVPRNTVTDLPAWREIKSHDYQHVFWSVNLQDNPALSCNGIRIAKIKETSHTDLVGLSDPPIEFASNNPKDGTDYVPFSMPRLSVVDHSAALRLKASRSELESKGDLQFSEVLKKDIALDFVAYCLVAAPTCPIFEDETQYARSYPLVANSMPLIKLGMNPNYNDKDSNISDDIRDVRSNQLRWTQLGDSCCPSIPWLLSQLNFNEVIWYGPALTNFPTKDVFPNLCGFPQPTDNLLVCYVRDFKLDRMFDSNRFVDLPFLIRLLRELTEQGVEGIGNASEIFGSVFGVPQNTHNAIKHHGNSEKIKTTLKPNSIRIGFPNSIDTDIVPPVIQSLVASQDALQSELTQALSHYVLWTRVNRPKAATEASDSVSKQWKELIGNRGIPFNEDERRNLISDACSNSARLAEYIEKWAKYMPDYLQEPY